MARGSDADVGRWLAEVPLSRLIEGVGVRLVRDGAQLVGRCPFHDDRSEALLVDPARGEWCCRGVCDIGGNAVDWVRRAQGVSGAHAAQLLRAGAVSLTVLAASSPRSEGAGPGRRSTAAKLEPLADDAVGDAELLSRVLDWYSATLADGSQNQDALRFLERRRIAHPDVARVFRLGIANRSLGYRLPHSRTVAGRALRQRLQGLGVLRASGHERLTGSLVIPVLDLDGHVDEVYGRRMHDDVRAGAPSHVVLSGQRRGVFNPLAFTRDELIVCASMIDALSLWCAGFRNVTASFGIDGWTDQMQSAVVAGAPRRVLIAYDRTPAGDVAARDLGLRLMAAGVECSRVELPAGADVNDVAVAAPDPSAALGRFLRSAAWMGAGHQHPSVTRNPADPLSPPVRTTRPALCLPAAPLAGTDSGAATIMDQPQQCNATRVPGAVAQTPTTEPAVAPSPHVVAGDQELVLVLGGRRWRVRGLGKVSSLDLLRVNVLVSSSPEPGPVKAHGPNHDDDAQLFHVDTLDLYSARARAVFVSSAAAELGLETEVVRRDLGKVLLACESWVDHALTVAGTPAAAPVAITDQAREEALAWLSAPDLMGRLAKDFATIGVVGETANILVGYLAALSRKLPHPLAVILQSTSAAGKSALMDAVLCFVPPEDRVSFSAITGQSLFYLGESDLSHKVLSIAERDGATRAGYALKILQSEGELSIASTGKDTTTGRLVTHIYRVKGPTAIALTTTAIDVDDELLNRCLVLTVDEDQAQTRAIHDAQRKAHTLAGLTGRAAREDVIELHNNAQRMLAPLPVVNPFADALTFTDGRTRTRRDHGKYLALISAVTLLHQHQRPRRTATIGGRPVTYVETTLADIAIANQLAHAVLGQSLDEVPPQTRRLLAAIHDHVRTQAATAGIDHDLVRFTRRDLREAFTMDGNGWGDTQLKVHLARLVDLELLTAHRLDRTSYTYQLAWRGEGRDGEPFLIGLTDPDALPGLGRPHDTGATYDLDASGAAASQPDPGRHPVGRQTAAGQTRADPAHAHPVPSPARAKPEQPLPPGRDLDPATRQTARNTKAQ